MSVRVGVDCQMVANGLAGWARRSTRTTLTDEELAFAIQHPAEKVDAARYFLDSAAGPASDFDPRVPRYRDWQVACDYTFA